MKAFAILSGGGAKGPALAGCVNAAISLDVQFEGYGGTSAGSIVALMASIGIVGQQLQDLAIDGMAFQELLDDKGVALRKAKRDVDYLLQTTKKFDPKNLIKLVKFMGFADYFKEQGLYQGNKLVDFCRQQILKQVPQLKGRKDLSFEDLTQNGCKPLKIVATDLQKREAAVFQQGSHWGSSVLNAVRASVAFPFVFRPLHIGQSRLVDGGLASNVPVFLFQEDQKRTLYPVLAFDIGADEGRDIATYDLNAFTRDLLSAALEASDSTMRSSLPNVKYIKVSLGENIDALDFDIDRDGRERLYRAGYEATVEALKDYYPLKLSTLRDRSLKQQLQTLYGRRSIFEPILEDVVAQCEDCTGLSDLRATIMLPTMHSDGSRMVVYSHNMEGASDDALILNKDAGCSGAAIEDPAGIMVADLEKSRLDYAGWKMTKEQASQVPFDRRSIMSVAIPIWHTVADLEPGKIERAYRIGALSIDTQTLLRVCKWDKSPASQELGEILFHWARIIGKLLAR